MLIFLLSVSIYRVGFITSVVAEPTVIRVPADYPTIQMAIDAASPGDVVLVTSGTYYEHVTVSKPLMLIGEDKATTIIDGNGTGTVVSVTADNVVINGFTTRNSGRNGYWSFVAGIYIHSGRNEIIGNILLNNNYGIVLGSYLKTSEGNTITGNIVQNNNYGVYSIFGKKNVISGNAVTDNPRYGIWFVGLWGNDSNTVTGNIVSNSQYGVSLDGLIPLGGTTSLDFRHSILQGSPEIPPPPLSNNTVSGNTITGNEYGIVVGFCSGNNISNNVIANNNNGVNLGESNNNTIIGNTISNNNLGINLVPSNNNTIYHNNFVENSQQLGGSDTSNTWDNGAEGNYWSDYTGLDDGSGGRVAGDGVGDTDLPHQGVDYYPLIVPWGPIPVVWNSSTYPVKLVSNSTVSAFQFLQPNKRIVFDVTGPPGTVGYCNITIPKTLLRDNPWTILLNTTDITAQTTITENETHTTLHFTYTHSTYKVQIIGTWVVPEFPATIILPLFMIITFCAVVLTKKRRS